jgi:hypothetical protein
MGLAISYNAQVSNGQAFIVDEAGLLVASSTIRTVYAHR